MADEPVNPEQQAGLPPRQTLSSAPTIQLRKPGSIGIQLRRPGDPAPAAPVAPAAPAAPVAPAAPAAPAAAPEAPAAKSATTRIQLPEAAAPAAPAADVQAAKSKTSRISLDSALGAAPDAGAPKTIRLKRPGEMSAPAAPIPVATPISAAVAGQTSRLPTSKLATAKLNDVAAAAAVEPAAEEAPLTRRKTIKVRRPGAPSVAPHVSVNAATDAAPAADGAATDDSKPWVAPQGSVPVAPVSDSAHWTFVAAAILSILVTLATIAVLAAQAWGPNASLTEFSSWPAGPDISLPGSYIQ